MVRKLNPTEHRARRNRTRLKKLAGEGRLRLSVFRSSKHISAQLIDDEKGVTVAAASTLDEAFKKSGKKSSDKEGAATIGKLIAERALAAGKKSVVFDRGRFVFHGRVKALADAAREGGLEF
ncbi:MAG: 50S ribosomal protein L18 [Alphaproteobacteria bacterium]|jgi:large subunit ribosomal protein L18|uniref:50S ribosomal protein L18 n=1 Tax=Vitreimonas flagellata TaxID=2560861 RepID=UPI00107559C4|nr:50S ribosomal protein L18 [Vitreimonas flagellata]